MTRSNKKTSPKKVLCIVLASIFAFIAVFLLAVRAYFQLPVLSYYLASEKAFIIPEYGQGFVAQGICYDEASDNFFVSGYMADGSASPVYVVKNGAKREYKKVTLYYEDGTPYKKHSGGISVHGDFVYVVGGDEPHLYIFSYSEILNAENGAKVKSVGTFDSPIGANDEQRISFTTATEKGIIAGKFYREQNYQSPESYAIQTADGTNHAIAAFYPFDDSAPFGLSDTPTAIYSLPDLVQGMAVEGDTMYLSTSYGVPFSHIYVHKLGTTNKTFSDTGIPLYILDSTTLVKDCKIAPMSEEIEIVDGKMYTMCESASNKYIFGKFTSSYWCYATEMSFFAK